MSMVRTSPITTAVRNQLNPNPALRSSLAAATALATRNKYISKAISAADVVSKLVREKALTPAFALLKKKYPMAAIGVDAVTAIWKLSSPLRQMFYNAAWRYLTSWIIKRKEKQNAKEIIKNATDGAKATASLKPSDDLTSTWLEFDQVGDDLSTRSNITMGSGESLFGHALGLSSIWNTPSYN
jgi:hypothetical protein